MLYRIVGIMKQLTLSGALGCRPVKIPYKQSGDPGIKAPVLSEIEHLLIQPLYLRFPCCIDIFNIVDMILAQAFRLMELPDGSLMLLHLILEPQVPFGILPELFLIRLYP